MSSVLQLLLIYDLVFLTTVLLLAGPASGGHVVLRADLTHVEDSHRGSKLDMLRRMAARTRARVEKRWTPPPARTTKQPAATVTASLSHDVDVADSEYLLHLGVGTQRVALRLETSSDLIWTQCGCAVCFDQTLSPVVVPAAGSQRGVSCFDPLCAHGGLPFSGCTLKDNLCFYAYSYPGNSVTTGKMYEDTFTFSDAVAVPGVRFGCGMYNRGRFESNETGVAGFGRGPLSLPSQLKLSRFSHCFTTVGESKSSPMFLGTPPNLEAQATGPFQSTPFAASPLQGPNSSLYYLTLKGITVGKSRLPWDESRFALRGDGSGGTIIDSGTAITTFPRAVFETIKGEFVRQVPLDVYDDTNGLCFYTTSNSNSTSNSSTTTTKINKQKAPDMPKLILHLEGADWDLPHHNYVFPFYEGYSSGICVVMYPSDDSDTTIIGNYQQQNMLIEYDLDNNKLGFVPARCDKL